MRERPILFKRDLLSSPAAHARARARWGDGDGETPGPIAPRIPLLADPWPTGSHVARACSICGRPWRPWAGSRLPCHATCLFTDEARSAIARRVRADLRPARAIADELGITTSVLAAVVASRRG